MHCWRECKLVQPLWKAVWSYLKKIKNGIALRPSDSTSGNLSKEIQNTNLKKYMYSYVHCSVIYNSQDLEAAQVSISRWVDKTAMVLLHNGMLLSLKKKNFTLCNSMNGPGQHYARRNKPIRDIHMIHWIPYGSYNSLDSTNDFSHMWNPVNKLN